MYDPGSTRLLDNGLIISAIVPEIAKQRKFYQVRACCSSGKSIDLHCVKAINDNTIRKYPRPDYQPLFH